MVSQRRSPRLVVVAVALVVEAALGVVGGLAGNVVSGLGRWPLGLDVVRRHAVRSLVVVFVGRPTRRRRTS